MRQCVPSAALGLLFAIALLAQPAQAVPLSAPAGLKDAADAVNITESVRCRLVWRCGYYGCGWRRVCWAPYGFYGYGYRPYGFYRPHWGYRHWGYRRHWW
jgi:hypothetical protein